MSSKRNAQSENIQDSAPKRGKNKCDSTTNSASTIQRFSYNAMKNILEHLTIEKRMGLFSNCPTIRSAERAANLNLDNLGFESETFTIDGQAFRVTVGRILAVPENIQNTGVELTETNPKLLMKKLIHSYLGGRTFVKVRRLSIGGKESVVGNLPEGLQIECEELELKIDGMRTFPALRPFLKGVKLRVLAINIGLHDQIPRDDLLLNSEYTEIYKYSVVQHLIADDLIALKSRHIHVVQMLPDNLHKFDVGTLALNWMRTDLAIGTRFTSHITDLFYTLELFRLLIIVGVGAKYGKVHLEQSSGTESYSCVTIPTTSETELNVFAVGHLLTMEIMRKGTARADQ